MQSFFNFKIIIISFNFEVSTSRIFFESFINYHFNNNNNNDTNNLIFKRI